MRLLATIRSTWAASFDAGMRTRLKGKATHSSGSHQHKSLRQHERQPKGTEQARAVGLVEQGQPGNDFLLQREHVDGVRGPRRIGVLARIGRESRLAVR